VRHVMRLLRRHYGKLAAISIPRPYHRGQETALGSWAGTAGYLRTCHATALFRLSIIRVKMNRWSHVMSEVRRRDRLDELANNWSMTQCNLGDDVSCNESFLGA
jgi:hypothetical protein